jgi:biotin transport system substrate-specific component
MGLAGPTGGYLVGFVVAAWLVSVLKGPQGAGPGRLFAAGAAGTLAVFAVGAAWRVFLAFLFGFQGGDVWLAAATGLLPFVPKAVVELIGAVMLVTSFRGIRLLRRRAL